MSVKGIKLIRVDQVKLINKKSKHKNFLNTEPQKITLNKNTSQVPTADLQKNTF